MWLKRVLIPFWVIELVWLVAIVVICAIDSEIEDEYGYGISIASIILLIMTGISMILDITAIILFARHKLSPVTYLVFQCIKTVFWTFVFVADIIAAAYGDENSFSFLWITVLFATSVGQLAYGSVIMHRKRTGYYQGGAYRGVETGYRGVEGVDGAGTRLNTGYESPPRGSYAAYNPHGAPPNPFRDPSPAPSAPAGQVPTATHPAFRPDSVGESSRYYDAGKYDSAAKYDTANAAAQSYEMQGVQGTAN